jgi:hypothetical protein
VSQVGPLEQHRVGNRLLVAIESIAVCFSVRGIAADTEVRTFSRALRARRGRSWSQSERLPSPAGSLMWSYGPHEDGGLAGLGSVQTTAYLTTCSSNYCTILWRSQSLTDQIAKAWMSVPPS